MATTSTPSNLFQTIAIVAGTMVSIFCSSLLGISWIVEAATDTLKAEQRFFVKQIDELKQELKIHVKKDNEQDYRITRVESRVDHLEEKVRQP